MNTKKKAKSGIKVTAERWDPISQSWVFDDGSYQAPNSSIYNNNRNSGIIPNVQQPTSPVLNPYTTEGFNQQSPQEYIPYNEMNYEGILTPNFMKTQFDPVTNNWNRMNQVDKVELQPQYSQNTSNSQREGLEAIQPSQIGGYNTIKGKRKSRYNTEYDDMFALGGQIEEDPYSLYQPQGQPVQVTPQPGFNPWQMNNPNSPQMMAQAYTPSVPNPSTTIDIGNTVENMAAPSGGDEMSTHDKVMKTANAIGSVGKAIGSVLNVGSAVAAVNGLLPNQDRQKNASNKPARAYNPYGYGTGSQAIAKDGLTVHDGGNAELISYNPYSPDTVQFNGASHENGGMPISYNGTQVEVEGGETMTGNTVFGNMKVPGTNKKFKDASKQIAKEENKATKILGKGDELLDIEPYNEYNTLKFNSGRVLKEAADIKLQELAKTKDNLAFVQDMMLQEKEASKQMKDGGKLTLAERNNNPGNMRDLQGNFIHFDSYDAGMKALQDKLNNAVTGKSKVYKQDFNLYDFYNKYAPSSDNNNPKLYAETVARKLGVDPNTKIKELGNKLNDWALATAQQEDIAYSKKMNPQTKFGLPSTTIQDRSQVITPITPLPIQNRIAEPVVRIPSLGMNVTNPSETPQPQAIKPQDLGLPQEYNYPNTPSASQNRSLADNNRLGFGQIAPELFAMAANTRPDFVQGQEYNPVLYTPYQVSFQDRINENNAQLNAIERSVPNNPSALATLAAQTYQANNSVLADQFRTNQGITNDITNRNVGLLNDAELKNLQLRDQQYQRQEQAQSNTKNRMFEAMSSLSNKFALKDKENMNIRMSESLFPNFRADDKGTIMINGEPHVFDNVSGSYVPVATKKTETVKDGDKVTKTQHDILNNRTKKKWGGWI